MEGILNSIINDDIRETLADYNQRIESNQKQGTIIEELNREKETYNHVKRQTEDVINNPTLPDGVLKQQFLIQKQEILKIHQVIELLIKKAKGKEKRTSRKVRNSGSDSASKSKMEHGGMRMRKKQTVRKQLKRRKTRKHRS
jgi:hypothetical protein